MLRLKISFPGMKTTRSVLKTSVLILAITLSGSIPGSLTAQPTKPTEESRRAKEKQIASYIVGRCDDFIITGKGDRPQWSTAEWVYLTKLDQGGKEYESKCKMLYSSSGIYVLFYGQDEKITTKDYKDFENLFNGDVFEVFFLPVPTEVVYFEYEVNQLDRELVLIISNIEGYGYKQWIPWSHRGTNESGVKKIVAVNGGGKKINGSIRSWSAEIFFPFETLDLLPGIPPKSGDIWNANFCRLDYDTGNMVKWSWTPSIKTSFHELEAFQAIEFQ
jgi:hypothetical protein